MLLAALIFFFFVTDFFSLFFIYFFNEFYIKTTKIPCPYYIFPSGYVLNSDFGQPLIM